MITTTSLTDKEYKLISSLVYDKSGINLGEQKRALIAGRLNKILRQHNFDTFMEYYDYLLADTTGETLSTLIDRISTNHTFFNRENDHFNYFSQKALPDIVQRVKDRKDNAIRIWCAGCSSGEESYTLAMLLLEHFGKEAGFWDLGILATDISTVALEKAKAGIYEADNISKLSPQLRNRYFKKLPDGSFQANDKLKKIILYKRFNLMNENFPFKNRFHAIFCRNVMIYFDKQTRETLTRKFHRFTEDEGYLFIGHSETLGRNNSLYRYINPALYKKVAKS